MAPRRTTAALAFTSTVVSTAFAQIQIDTCGATGQHQDWVLTTPGPTTIMSSGTTLCLAAMNCSSPPLSQEDVVLEACGSTRCPGSAQQLWTVDSSKGWIWSALSTSPTSPMCLTLDATYGPGVNLWPCAGGGLPVEWSVVNTTKIVTQQGGSAAGGCLGRSAQPGGVIDVNGSVVGRRFDGVGGLAAIGGARMLYEYEEPWRANILDLLFSPGYGGSYSILKIEIEGDVDSSYGSGPSYQHTADPSSRSFHRGIYLPWLIGEAKARNPNITLFALSWGIPGWIADGYQTQQTADYHVNYLVGAREVWGYEFDFIGVHNERPIYHNYVKLLRASLDAANFTQTKIVVNDMTDGNGCADCNPAWGGSLHAALANDPELRAAVGVIGVHSGDVEGVSPFPGDWEAYGMSYWQSESNVADGAMPQWEPNDGSAYGTGLAWVRVFLANYIRARATATILCPLAHSFTWNYGREMHGTTQLMEGWSGYYELGSGFWGQMHFTQFAMPGWAFLDGDGSGQFCSGGSGESCYLLWTTLVSPSGTDMTLVVVNTQPDGSAPLNLTYLFTGSLSFLASSSLASWRTVRDDYFSLQGDVQVDAMGFLNVSLPPRSIFTFTTLRSGVHPLLPAPDRAPFPLPFTATFDDQPLESPGRYLSDLWAAFHVQASPDGSQNQALWQAVSIDASPNSWLGSGVPFTSLPSGTNFANAAFSASVYFASAEVGASGPASVYICGRVPIWQPAYFQGSFSLGICLTIERTNSSTWTWALADNAVYHSSLPLASGDTGLDFLDTWRSLSLVFNDDSVTASLGGVPLVTKTGLRASAGVAGLGSGWNTVYFDNVTLTAAPTHTRHTSSFLYDLLPGERALTNLTGWAGMALDLSSAPACRPSPYLTMQNLTVAALGRFRSAGNAGSHKMDIVRASDGTSVLPGGPVVVGMDAASCPSSDLLGMCYSAPIAPPALLTVGDVYYIVSLETAGGDAVREMTSPAKGTTHANGKRDGTTLMSYRGPTSGCIAGRVTGTGGAGSPPSSWTVIPDLDTSFGPVNFLLSEA
jgi:hypothetical protein